MLKKIILLALLMAAVPARAESITTITSGLDYSSGNYGTSDTTTILYVPVTLKTQFDYSYIKLTLPYISVSSIGGVVQGIGPIKKGGTKVTTNSGLGDAVLSAGYTAYETEQIALDAVANIKFGTADAAKNLGTGENDYSAQLDGFYTVNKLTWFATAGYKVVGVPPGASLHNIFYGSAGASRKFSDVASGGVMLNAAQSSSDVAPGPLDVTFFIVKKFNQTSKVQLGLLKGLSDASPDIGISIMITGTL